ncbi:hypothetical protein C8Q77DRAFT_520284 [Trametes polyzona]|nr:hypothetical protein C8Q77DRAFT_520284 [Trametes polyzona]
MDPSTPVNVAKGAAATSVVAGTFAALHGLYRGSRHPAPLALSAGANGGIAGAIFFGIREVIVSPLLQTTLRRGGPAQEPSGSETSTSRPTWTQLRTHHLLDSATSGALTGAIINKWRNGRVLAGARTAALLCTLVQLGFNELGVWRIKYVTRKIQEKPAPAPLPAPAENTSEPKMSFFDRAMSLIGFRKLSEEEYLKVLKKQRDEALERIAVLEREKMEKERAREQAEQLTSSEQP